MNKHKANDEHSEHVRTQMAYQLTELYWLLCTCFYTFFDQNRSDIENRIRQDLMHLWLIYAIVVGV